VTRPGVVFLTTEYPTEQDPAAGIFIREHALAAAEVADVAVVHLARERGRQRLYDVTRVESEALPTWRVRYRRFGRPLSYAAFLAGAAAGVRQARAVVRPSLLHAHSHLAMVPAMAIGAARRLPVAYTEHWSIFLPANPNELSPAMSRAARVALRRAAVVLPVSEAMRSALATYEPRARFVVVPNAVDTSLFKPSADRSAAAAPRLFTAGGLTANRSKGIDFLLEAARLLHERGVHFTLELAGDGPRRAEYEALARRGGLEERVRFLGFLPKPELAERMRAADLFVLASRFENNPCVVIEALASGLPVVATRVGGIPEMIDDENGLLVAPQDAEELAAGIEAALGRLPQFDPQAISANAGARYGRAQVGLQLETAYREALERA
jgi:glycosyltransferase involved in cell wall biosynthesis